MYLTFLNESSIGKGSINIAELRSKITEHRASSVISKALQKLRDIRPWKYDTLVKLSVVDAPFKTIY